MFNLFSFLVKLSFRGACLEKLLVIIKVVFTVGTLVTSLEWEGLLRPGDVPSVVAQSVVVQWLARWTGNPETGV